MHYLIDGHNLIGKLPDIDLDDPHDEVKLVLKLKGWAAARRGRRVTVYFDGGLPAGVSAHLSSSQVKVVFAAEGRSADARIARKLQEIRNPAAYTLVTSDVEVATAAEVRRVRHITSEQFAERLAGETDRQPERTEEEEPALSEQEVADWLALFGDSDGEDRKF